jgi:hypothetical protein
MAKSEHEDRPVRDDGEAPRNVPFRAGQKTQATSKNELLSGGPGTGYIPGRADSPKLANMYVQDRVPYKRPGYKPGVVQAGPRSLPREVPVYSIPAPGGTGRFTRYADGHTEHHRARPEMMEYANSLDLSDPDEADEHRDLMNQVQAADETWGHKFW